MAAVERDVTLVTGATGFAGGHLLDRLNGRGPIVAWHRPATPPPLDRGTDVEWRPVDLVDAAGVAEAVARARPARIFHLAGAPQVAESWRNVMPALETNVLGTHHLIEAVRRRGSACRILVVSSASVYGATDGPLDEEAALVPASPYGLSKLAQDQLAVRAFEEDGLDVVVARPFNHAGPRQVPAFAVASFARQIALIEAGRIDPEIRVGNLDARRDLTDVRDVVDAYEHLMERAPAGRPYNVCSGRAVRVGDLLESLLARSGARIRVVQDPDRLRPNDTPLVLGDPTRIHTELDWSARISIADLLRDTLDWWRASVGAAA